uniref:Uncharacterized protein n=1 Tax=Quercus lobata TaxID=97700 RepID=A0A7N2MVD7_QUELO
MSNILSEMRRAEYTNYVTILNAVILIQYVPRVLQIYLSLKKLDEHKNIPIPIRASFNFFLYVLAGYPRTTQSSADPKPHQKKKDKTGIGPDLKENLRIFGTAALIAIQCAAPDRAVLSSFINHPQQFRDWTDGTNVSFVKIDPTRGRRTANAG